ncbi:type II toxin-antitoxin system Phd/YefM family antitoxin [Longimicrobium sp.]|uniref:type II toxin-antitoxin system Phd/YefM family antitoxin n=1 Tax=Longimicrobium sp. TaxID=2029185 RepID=UPI002C70EE8F|nr:type II toxin-antitoxin system Phd/YefM family antitoxin [Longimicrobium sp.]HSU16769.1 type II toxin-antitoxin system Phd/YefM family antitoxin [Longimicrobium sp.]
MYERDPSSKPRRVREAAARWETLPREQEWVSAADFKAQCLRLIEAVRQGQREVVVTRYGKPVAKLVPYPDETMSFIGHLKGTVVSHGDIVSPIGEEWEADTDA